MAVRFGLILVEEKQFEDTVMTGKVERICRQCGKAFLIYPAWIRKGAGKNCSKECHNEAQTGPARRTRDD